MYFKDIVGRQELKSRLIRQVKDGHVGHALLFIGNDGGGNLPLALAFASYVLCQNPGPTDRCGTCRPCNQLDKLAHPDLHFSFPIILQEKIKVSSSFTEQFVTAIIRNPFLTLPAWEIELNGEKKKSLIPKDESDEIRHKLALKSFDGGHKIMIIWRADRLNDTSNNKLLKTIEEPVGKTIIILVVPDATHLPVTIVSRTQKIGVENAEIGEVANWLEVKFKLSPAEALERARIAQGDLHLATELAHQSDLNNTYLPTFVAWMRAAVTGKSLDLIKISEEVSRLSRENQQQFLTYSLSYIEQSLRYVHLGAEFTAFSKGELDFAQKFAPTIAQTDLAKLQGLFSKAHYMVERNINSALLFLKLGADIARVLQGRKAPANA